jgi:hypothetical protein
MQPHEPFIDLIFLYYDNPKMLANQAQHWNTYPKKVHVPVRINVIDDGSPKVSARSVLERTAINLPLRLFRILDDIPWNFTGARNLGCANAAGWIYMSDIDSILFADDAHRLFDQCLNPMFSYITRRVRFEDEREVKPAITNLLFHKTNYTALGGYNEDYAGYYGRGDTEFWLRLKSITPILMMDSAALRLVSTKTIPDASTRGMSRDKTRNTKLFESRKRTGFSPPSKMLRFKWERVF